MGFVTKEIMDLEEGLRQAELGPDASFFEDKLAPDVVLTSETGDPLPREKVIEAHSPNSSAPKFTKVEMTDMNIVDHGNVAVVSCKGTFESAKGSFTLKFLRVWMKQQGGWRIIAASIAK